MADLQEVVSGGLCLGCGLCAAMPGANATMAKTPSGRYEPAPGSSAPDLDKYCPGLLQRLDPSEPGTSLDPVWGPFAKAVKTWSPDETIRHAGSSGGAVTALAVHLLESGAVDGVLHVKAVPGEAFENRASLSRARQEVLQGASSRYAPALVFDRLGEIFQDGSVRRIAVVGKPCDIGAVRNLQRIDPEWRDRIPWTIAIFCAGQPSFEGTRALSRDLGLPADPVSVRYRGEGWPGHFVAIDADGRKVSTTYAKSWGTTLNRHLHPRCKICPDGTGMQADFSVGDAWETESGYPDFGERPGISLVVARDSRASRMLDESVQAGALAEGSPTPLSVLDVIQSYQKERRRFAFFRLAGFVLAGGIRPRFQNHGLASIAIGAPWLQGLRQGWGMFKRARKARNAS